MPGFHPIGSLFPDPFALAADFAAGLLVPVPATASFGVQPAFSAGLQLSVALSSSFAVQPSFAAAPAEQPGLPATFAVQPSFSAGLTLSVQLAAAFAVAPSFAASLIPPLDVAGSYAVQPSFAAGLQVSMALAGGFAVQPSFSAAIHDASLGASFAVQPGFSAGLSLAIPLGATFGVEPALSVSSLLAGAIACHIYANAGAGGPVNYTAPIATVTGLTWTSPPLAIDTAWTFGVRPFNSLENQNVDAIATVIVDAAGNDVAGRPNPPTAVAARASKNGSAVLAWTCFPGGIASAPTAFLAWLTAGPVVNYAVPPIATFAAGAGPRYTGSLPIGSLLDGVVYTVGMRSMNAVGTEPNVTAIASVTGEVTPPAEADGLTATITSQP